MCCARCRVTACVTIPPEFVRELDDREALEALVVEHDVEVSSRTPRASRR